MKKKISLLAGIILLSGLFLVPNKLFAQATGSVGIGTTTPFAGAALDISSTDKGLLIPRLTAAQRTALEASFATNPAAANGLMIYNTTTFRFNYWNSGSLQWNDVGVGGSTAVNGTQWHVGAGAPPGGIAPSQGALGADFDFYLDANTGDIYRKASGNWSIYRLNGIAANLKGPAGVAGGTIGNALKLSFSPTSFTVNTATSTTISMNATGAAIGNVVSISPSQSLDDALIIAYARVSAANVIEVKFFNASAANITVPTMSFDISIIQ